MKKTLFLLAFLLCILNSASAQQYDVLDQVKADWRKAAGMEGPHRFDVPEPTPAPKGYTPFYISHYGRHGSRYAWNAKTYSLIHEVLSAAHEEGTLTPLGEEFYQDFESFYPTPLINTGDLTPLGWGSTSASPPGSMTISRRYSRARATSMPSYPLRPGASSA